MYARLLHLGHRRDRTFQFAFQRPAIVDVLHELGGTQKLLLSKISKPILPVFSDTCTFRLKFYSKVGQARGGYGNYIAGV